MTPTLPVYILAGGRSSRFGSDKARALAHGQPLLLRIAHHIAPVASSITAVADAPDKYADLHLRTIPDLTPGNGPMSGLQTALHDCAHPWLLLLSCDLITLRPTWIDQLLAHRHPNTAAVAFRHTHWEPLIALYHHRLRPEVDHRLRTGQRRMQSLLTDAHATAVPLPSDWPALTQANTPADLSAALAHGDPQ